MHEKILPTKLIETDLESGINFLSLINKHGRLKNSVQDKNFVLSDKTSEMLFMSLRLQNSLQSDFSGQFGKVSKITIEHENSKLFLYPVESSVAVVITEKNFDESKLDTVISNLNFLTNKIPSEKIFKTQSKLQNI